MIKLRTLMSIKTNISRYFLTISNRTTVKENVVRLQRERVAVEDPFSLTVYDG